MIKVCCICGCEFEAKQKKQVTCGDEDCRRIQHLAYMRNYGRKHRKGHREYNRTWMAEYRAGIKAAEEAKMAEPLPNADTYAERQIAKTLEMVGRVQI